MEAWIEKDNVYIPGTYAGKTSTGVVVGPSFDATEKTIRACGNVKLSGVLTTRCTTYKTL